jgi:hypothetical protein
MTEKDPNIVSPTIMISRKWRTSMSSTAKDEEADDIYMRLNECTS